MICPHCSQEHPDNAQFCPVTGQALQAAAPAPAPAPTCPHCGKPVQAAWDICGYCGKPLRGAAPAAGIPTPPAYVAPPAAPSKPAALRKLLPLGLAIAALAVVGIVVAAVLLLNPFAGGDTWLTFTRTDDGVTAIQRLNGSFEPTWSESAKHTTYALRLSGESWWFGSTFARSSFSPDGKYFLFLRSDASNAEQPKTELVLMNINGDEIVLDTYQQTDDEDSVGMNMDEVTPVLYLAEFSPDGRYLAYMHVARTPDYDTLLDTYIVDMKGQVVATIPDTYFVRFVPGKKQWLGVPYDNDSSVWPLELYQFSGEHIQTLADDVEDNIFGGVQFSGNGQYLFFTNTDDELIQYKLSSGEETTLLENAMAMGISPDGEQLVVSGDYDGLQLYNIRSGEFVDVASIYGEYYSGSMDFSADGKYLLFTNGGELNVYNIAEEQLQSVPDSYENILFAEFTPNGKNIVFLANASEEFGELYSAALDGLEPKRLDQRVASFQVSRDGKRVLYYKVSESSDGYNSTLYRVNIDGGSRKKMADAAEGLIKFMKP